MHLSDFEMLQTDQILHSCCAPPPKDCTRWARGAYRALNAQSKNRLYMKAHPARDSTVAKCQVEIYPLKLDQESDVQLLTAAEVIRAQARPRSDHKKQKKQEYRYAISHDVAYNWSKFILAALKPGNMLRPIGADMDGNPQDDGLGFHCGAPTVLQRARGPVQDLAAFLFAALSYAVCHSSAAKETKVVTKHHLERELPLAGIIWFVFARYVLFPRIVQGLFELTGDCIILEDASLSRRRIPLSHCRHFKMLKALLEVHYEGRPGEILVQAGQFNLTYSSRRGPAIRNEDWPSKSFIKQGSHVVLSLYLKTDKAICAVCHTTMDVSVTRQPDALIQALLRYTTLTPEELGWPHEEQPNRTNMVPERLVQLMSQLEGTFPEPGLMRQDCSIRPVYSATEHTEHTEHVKDIYHFE
ncbi:hypothetical protein LTR70_005204 [Exophiala xenobiotica]|uniref:Ubiquitin-like domain-containing protein n=1 Tax=Lithohypha guttulata TaxID=1690604 RepID=A0ABR0KB59_9EURO|nr:hypothetical protein LTR24_004727 [Lithohypha guttulata]KAK5318908.1 hypothetical protein LTR70_005204 [Exophiala xenobiotica]